MNNLIINNALGKNRINKNIYGHFIEHIGRCIYGGLFVGDSKSIKNNNGIHTNVIEALNEINIPVLRWPGGCFADRYHWMDGIGPRKSRPLRTNIFWGGVPEDNSFGTHEFFELCEMLGCEPYICGNIGSGSVQEMADWIEYITSNERSLLTDLRKQNGRKKSWDLKYFGLGNELWGYDGNMKPEYYCDLYNHYQSFIDNKYTPIDKEFSKNIYKIACGPYGINPDVLIPGLEHHDPCSWTEILMKNVGSLMDGLSLHYYVFSEISNEKFNSFVSSEERDWFKVLSAALYIERVIEKIYIIMEKYDPNKNIDLIVDEWGVNHLKGMDHVLEQQPNTLLDAMVAAITLNIFNNHCDRVKMANIAQMVNVSQSLIKTEKEKIVLTPTYYVFKMYKIHQDSTWLPATLECDKYKYNNECIPQISCSASMNSKGVINLTLCNTHLQSQAFLNCRFVKAHGIKEIKGNILTSECIYAQNTFKEPDNIAISNFYDFKIIENNFSVKLPPKSIVLLSIY